MKKFKLKSNTVKSGEVPRKCIEVYSYYDVLLCIIWADNLLSPQNFDFELKEIEYFVDIAKRFYTTFDNLEILAQKDQEIQELLAQVKQQEVEMSFMINNSQVNKS